MGLSRVQGLASGLVFAMVLGAVKSALLGCKRRFFDFLVSATKGRYSLKENLIRGLGVIGVRPLVSG